MVALDQATRRFAELMMDAAVSSAIRGKTMNAAGEEFTDSLGPRDIVAQAIVEEVEAGRGLSTPDGRRALKRLLRQLEEILAQSK